jgi:SAM-dependent methyltransferase
LKINDYYRRRLTENEVSEGLHRSFIGGMWDELGKLQIDFVRAEGLQAGMNFLDVGCGPLRGGVRFIDFLDAGNYYGVDINQSLLDAGYERELSPALRAKTPRKNLLCDEHFGFSRFGRTFDYAVAQSVFSHLPLNHIRLCLIELGKCMRSGGKFYATFFESPAGHPLDQPLVQQPGGVTTYADQDPYHYKLADFSWCIGELPWQIHYVGEWNHPRAQKMLRFTRK